MAKYIDADCLRAEIDKERTILEATRQGCGLTEYGCGRLDAFRLIDSIIDSLQQEQPEVDIRKELYAYICSYEYLNTREDGSLLIARHFAQWGAEHLK